MQNCTASRRLSPLALALAALASCGGQVEHDDPPQSSSAAGGGSEAKSCELVDGPIELVAEAANPAGCEASMSCEVWFGHGQHLRCPDYASAGPSYVECDVWDCVCSVYGEAGFFADFSTGEVVDARVPGRVCRYRLEAIETEG